MFLSENEDLKGVVGMRKFAEFRPSDVIFQCDKSSLKICLCRYCHNPKRVIASSVLSRKEFSHIVDCPPNQPIKPKMFVEKIMCQPATRECFMRSCQNCRHKTEELENEIGALCEDLGIEMVHYEMWSSTDRTNVVEFNEPCNKFAQSFSQMIDKLASHTYEHENQTAFYEQLKSNVPENVCLAAGDFGKL